MNYQKIYDQLIDRARIRLLECYTESHHIVPRCIGGNDTNDNLVNLTPEEHYLAHQLLVKIYPSHHGLAQAAAMMANTRPTNKLYGWLRRRHSTAMSVAQSGALNSQYGTKWIYNLDLEICKKVPNDTILDCEWKKGRIIDFVIHKERIREKEKIKQENLDNHEERIREKEKIKQEKLDKHIQVAYNWYSKFQASDSTSLREYVRCSDYDKSHVSFIKMLKRHVVEFNPQQGKEFIPE
jgi:hypothetical protein